MNDKKLISMVNWPKMNEIEDPAEWRKACTRLAQLLIDQADYKLGEQERIAEILGVPELEQWR